MISAFWMLFFSYGHLLSFIENTLSRMNLLEKAWFLIHGGPARTVWLTAGVVLLAGISYAVLRQKGDLRVITDFLNVSALALLVMVIINFLSAGGFNSVIVPYLRSVGGNQAPPQPTVDPSTVGAFEAFLPLVTRNPEMDTDELAPAQSVDQMQRDLYADDFSRLWLEGTPTGGSPPTPPPDIYYIILDSYIRADFLEEEFSYDNSDFLSSLRERGFFIADESHSNYPYTITSLPTTLNFMHLEEIAAEESQFTNLSVTEAHWLLSAMISESRLMHYLDSLDYTTIAFHTGYWFTELENFDRYLKPSYDGWHPDEFEYGLIKLTPIGLVAQFERTSEDYVRDRVLFALEHTADATEIDGPVFVLAHIGSPHAPYVFGPHGQPVATQDYYSHDEYIEAYRNQVIHINNEIEEVIDEILSNSPEPPIIILQGDHGACYGTEYDFLAYSCLEMRMSILNAYYFPDQDYADLYPGITPVNSFRVILNNYFGMDYEMLPDRSFYSYPDSLFHLSDVTEQVAP
jgi:hypothetical protein